MAAILKRELKMYYSSLFAYIYYAVFFLVTGIFFSICLLDTHSTEFGYYVLGTSFYVIVLMLPFCTMKLFAIERKYKTDQLLFTAPVSSFSILFAKYFATFIFTMLPLMLSVVYPIIISNFGTMDIRFLSASYLGCFLVTLLFMTIGIFVSTLTTNGVLAVVVSYVIYALIILSRMIEALVPIVGVRNFVREISAFNKFNDMISGIVRSGDIVYLLAVTIVFFLLTWIVLESRRVSMSKTIIHSAVVIAIGVFACFLGFSNNKVYDFTAEKLLTLSEQTIDLVEGIQKDTTVYYIGKESTANATYRELLNKYDAMNDKLHIEYKDVSTDLEFQMTYMSDLNYINEASMLVLCGERYIYLDSADYITSKMINSYSNASILEIESQLTKAIYYVNQDESTLLTTVTGHSEKALNSEFSNLLSLSGFEMKSVDLPSQVGSLHNAFRDDCEVVMIYAPQTDYNKEEIKLLEDYLKDGGNLFVVLDPLTDELENLYSFLKKYGLDVQSGVVIERQTGMYTENVMYYLLPELMDCEFTKNIMNENLSIHAMTSKGILPKGTGNGYQCVDLLMTSGKSFSKINDYENIDTDGEYDVGGPFSVASCAQSETEGSLFLLTSDVFFHAEADAASVGANRRFFLEVMNGLVDNDSTIWIEGKQVGNQVALYPHRSKKLMKVFLVVVIPFVIIVFGVIVIWLRVKNVLPGLRKKKVKSNENEYESRPQEEE
ncbi:MAG: hypothetical protein E7264_02770 [Lachnospiraceae bacterium]|nr:hypothetical protein [Lachnospiraceae bacterium]